MFADRVPPATKTVDVVVCGGGPAGLAAAAAAGERGITTLVLEKSPWHGGAALLSNGTLWTSDSVAAAMTKAPRASEHLLELIIGEAPHTVEWLTSLGVEVGPTFPMANGTGRIVDPHDLVDGLAGGAQGAVLTGAPMTGIATTDDGELVVTYHRDDGPRTVVARAIVLATGGFQGSPEFLQRYGISPAALYYRSNPWATGDGLAAALALGAQTTDDLSTFYGHAMPAKPAKVRSTLFRELTQYYGDQGVAVNLAGERFVDESAGTGEECVNEALARQPGAQGYYLGDGTVHDGEALLGRLTTKTVLDRAEAAGAEVVCTPTREALLDSLHARGVPRDTLVRSLAPFMSGGWDGIWPPRRDRRTMSDAGPWFAVKVQSSITFTGGGIAVDDELRLLARNRSTSPLATLITDTRSYQQEPLSPALFACGSDIGGFNVGAYLGGLLPAVAGGRIAGANAASIAIERSQ